jgi:hypothetical protein
VTIPKSFRLAGDLWKVVIAKKPIGGFGECDFEKRIIRIAATINGKPISTSDQLKTFLHEWWHAFEHVIGRDVNETDAIQFENMMYQTLTTMRGNQNEV